MYCIAIHYFMICIVSRYTISWYVLYRDTLFHDMYCIAIHYFMICIVSRYTISWYVWLWYKCTYHTLGKWDMTVVRTNARTIYCVITQYIMDSAGHFLQIIVYHTVCMRWVTMYCCSSVFFPPKWPVTRHWWVSWNITVIVGHTCPETTHAVRTTCYNWFTNNICHNRFTNDMSCER